MKTLIHNATIVNEGRIFTGSVIIDNDIIEEIIEGESFHFPLSTFHLQKAEGLILMPGVIDTHVHFRDGGNSENPAGNFESESRAARAGGVTSVVDMPNTNPQTTSLETLERKEQLAARVSAVNYGFMLGATNDNIVDLLAIEPTRYAAIKLFLGSSTGNMLVNDPEQLDRLFRDSRKLIVAHCEQEDVVQANMHNFKLQYQGTPQETAALHPQIRNTEACFLATYHAIERARQFGTRFHVAHISTATELSLLSNFDLEKKNITAEVTPNHLCFDDRDYAELGNKIKCNPAIKSNNDRLTLWAALEDDLIDTVATDHAPHPLEAKMKPYFDAPSGIPSIQHSLQMMLEVVFSSEFGVKSPELPVNNNNSEIRNPNSELRIPNSELRTPNSELRTPNSELRTPNSELLPLIVRKMCHNPALLFGIEGRGFIRPGYKADLVLVRPNTEYTVTKENLLYKCGWSPLEGQTFHTSIEQVWVNGQTEGGAEQLKFNK